MVTLTNDEIKCISIFESLTGATAKDCLLEEGRVVFVVRPGDMGKAIGKGGAAIMRVRQAFRKSVEVFENAETLKGFVRNLFPGVRITKLDVKEGPGPGRSGERQVHSAEGRIGTTGSGMSRKIVQIKVDDRDRGAVIGRGGERIKLARRLLERHHGAELKLL